MRWLLVLSILFPFNSLATTYLDDVVIENSCTLPSLTIDRAVYINSSNVLSSSVTTTTELGYLSGVTSAIQTQLNGKQASGSYLTAPVLLGSQVSGTLPIVNGGTGQTSSNAALNALLPSQGGNNGKALFTDGTNTAWQTAAGSGTVTSVAVTDSTGVLAPTGSPITSSGTIDLPFTHVGGSVAFLSPLGGSIGAPLFRSIDLSDLPSYPPSKVTGGGALTFAGFNSGGDLDQIPGWSFDNGTGASSVYAAKDVTALGGFTTFAWEAPTEQTANSSQNITTYYIDSHFDRNHTDTNLAGQYTGLSLNHRSEGAGSVNGVFGINLQTQVGNGAGGHANQLVGIQVGANASAGTTVDQAFAMNLSVDSTGATIADESLLNISNNGNISNNAQMINVGNNAAVGAGLSLINLFNQNTATVGGDFRYISGGNNGNVAGFSSFLNAFDNNTITKGETAFGYYHQGNVGDGSGVNFSLVDGNQNNGTVDGNGNIFTFNTNSIWNQGFNGFNMNLGGGSAEFKQDVNMVNLYNNALLTGATNTLRAMAFTNNSDGYRVVAGVSAYTNGNMTEEIRGSQYGLDGNSRTKTGLDLNLQGAAVDDATGIRVNVSNQTSTSITNHVKSGDFQGGTFSVQGGFSPFSGAGLEIGNVMSITDTIQSGAPLTGTDQIIQLFQSNLIVSDDIATGPFGFDTNMVGMVAQIQVDSGKTVPIMRSLLLGTSVPAGSGGTITEHVALEILGLPSFGGSLSNPTRTGIQDSTLLGQNFCGGAGTATTCHFINVRDGDAQNSFAGGVQLTTSGTQPTCDVQHRGTMWNVEGGTGIPDLFQVCQKDALDNYNWVTH